MIKMSYVKENDDYMKKLIFRIYMYFKGKEIWNNKIFTTDSLRIAL